MLLGRANLGLSMAQASRVSLRTLVTSYPRRKNTSDSSNVPEQPDPIQMILMEKIKDYRGKLKPPSDDTAMSKELKAELEKFDQLFVQTTAAMSTMNVTHRDAGAVDKTLAKDKIISPGTILSQDSNEMTTDIEPAQQKIGPSQQATAAMSTMNVTHRDADAVDKTLAKDKIVSPGTKLSQDSNEMTTDIEPAQQKIGPSQQEIDPSQQDVKK